MSVVITNERVKKKFSWEEEEEGRIEGEGEEVIFHTTDRVYEKFSCGEKLELEEINEVSGPLVISKAEEGDVVRVVIIDIQITRCWSVWDNDEGTSGCLAKKRALVDGNSSVRELPIDRENKLITVSERMKVPLEPMIGCIATSPSPHSLHQFGCGCSSFEPTYAHGGNMDLREMEVGAEVHLPVMVKGAFLYVGDLHAAMGRGEITWTGFESSGVVTLRVYLYHPSIPLPFPRLRHGNRTIFTVVHRSSYQSAFQLGLEMVFDYLLSPPPLSSSSLSSSSQSEESSSILSPSSSEFAPLTYEEAFAFCTSQVEVRMGGPASKQLLFSFPSPSLFFS